MKGVFRAFAELSPRVLKAKLEATSAEEYPQSEPGNSRWLVGFCQALIGRREKTRKWRNVAAILDALPRPRV